MIQNPHPTLSQREREIRTEGGAMVLSPAQRGRVREGVKC